MTCHCTYAGSGKQNDCPGHFGHIELAKPVYHVGYIDQVVKLLRCVCFHCSRLMVDRKKAKRILTIKDPETRSRHLHEHCRNKRRCEISEDSEDGNQMDTFMKDIGEEQDEFSSIRTCGGLAPRYTRKGVSIVVEYPNEMQDIPGTGQNKQSLSAKSAYDILKKISDQDCITLGLDPKWSRPEWLILTVLPVPPPHVRPPVEMDGVFSEDDLTHQLIQIVKTNLTMENALQKGEHPTIIETLEKTLQSNVTCLFDNERTDTPRAQQRSGRPLKAIGQRLKGKEGRVRGNLMGKRVDFSARTVITADPNIQIDQVGVPRSVALRLTVPVAVTPHNIHELQELVAKGPEEHPGAMYIIRQDGRRIDLRHINSKNDLILEVGWVVERHLRDDDVVLFNRQPSLHRMSIMGHRAKVLDWSTFRLNLSVTKPYNADFDGDEMNLHVPQSLTARADAENLMMVPRNIINPQNNSNIMGVEQDSLLGVTRMTKRDVFIEKEVFMNAMMWIQDWDGILPVPCILKPRPLWSGKQLFSMICPRINYQQKSSITKEISGPNPFCLYDAEVLILDGELLHGVCDKKTCGQGQGSLVHVLQIEKGFEDASYFLNNCQFVVNYWMVNTSYTVGISDTVASLSTIKSIQKDLENASENVMNIMAKAQDGKLEGQPGKTLVQTFEFHVNAVLNGVVQLVGKTAKDSLKVRNAILGTVMAGSKGSINNIAQIISAVGQQNVMGGRIGFGFERRTLPHFAKDDLGMASRGFVRNSYLKGLTPTEFYFHAMGGREGVIDTAVKTSEVGYIQRRLVKAMETVSARYDSTLRNSGGCVMQFLYGEDGVDAIRVEPQEFDTYSYEESKFRAVYYMDVSSKNFGLLEMKGASGQSSRHYLDPEVVADCRQDAELRLLLEEEYEQLCQDRVSLREILDYRGDMSNASIQLPVNINRLLWNAQRNFKIDLREPTSLHPRTIIEGVRQLCVKDIIVVRGDDMLSREAQENSTHMFQILLRSKLASKRILKQYRLNEHAFDWLLGEIKSSFHQAMVSPGEMAGVISAQSLGQLVTQMTLNTFHQAGNSSKNVTLGVPRLNEILNVAQNPRTPNMTIFLKEEFQFKKSNEAGKQYAEEHVKILKRELEYIVLGDIVNKTEIHYDPDPKSTVIQEDRELVENYVEFFEEDFNVGMSPWVLRIVLNNDLFHVKSLQMDEISNKIVAHFSDQVCLS